MEQERQVFRDQIKVSNAPSAWKGEGEEHKKALPRLGRVELRKG